MKLVHAIYLVFWGSIVFGEAPWDLSLQSKELLQSQIEAKYQKRISESSEQKIPYLIDYCRVYLNFSSESCSYCQNHDPGQNLEDKMRASGFQKKASNGEIKAHCFGSTLFFVKYLITHPQIKFHSCERILSDILNDPSFQQSVHNFSVNQEAAYFLENLNGLLRFDIPSMKLFFQLLMGELPVDYYCPPISKCTDMTSVYTTEQNDVTFDKVTIYTILQNFPNRLLIVTYDYHCIAISTDPQKLFVFDSNFGLFQFADIETLSCVWDKFLNGGELHYLVSFAFPTEEF